MGAVVPSVADAESGPTVGSAHATLAMAETFVYFQSSFFEVGKPTCTKWANAFARSSFKTGSFSHSINFLNCSVNCVSVTAPVVVVILIKLYQTEFVVLSHGALRVEDQVLRHRKFRCVLRTRPF